MEKLSEGEYRLMEVLWEAGPVNSTRLVELGREKLAWNKSTTYTVLRRLKQKGAVRHENALVTPLLTRQEALRAQGEEVVERAGGLPLFLTAFLGGRKLPPRRRRSCAASSTRRWGRGEPWSCSQHLGAGPCG